MKNYLPSKKFMYLLASLAVFGLLLLIIYSTFTSKKSFFSSKTSQLQAENPTLNDLLKRDSDGDGVTDWEEALWGTDSHNPKTYEGMPDKTYIENKRKELKMTNPDGVSGVEDESETAKFARQFFASIATMKETGQIDQTIINNVANSLGQGIVNPDMTDAYTDKDIALSKNDSQKDQENYYVKAANLYAKYEKKGIGEELELIASMAGSGTSDKASITRLAVISSAYQGFARDLTLVPVPESLKTYHLQIINYANNTGIAVKNMTKVVDDPVVGLSGVSEYQKYSNELINSVQNLETFLSVNGIINQ